MITEFDTASDGDIDELFGEVFFRKTQIIIQCSLCFDEFGSEFDNYVKHLIKVHRLNGRRSEEDELEEKILNEWTDVKDESIHADSMYDNLSHVQEYYEDIENSFQSESIYKFQDYDGGLTNFPYHNEVKSNFGVEKEDGLKETTKENEIDVKNVSAPEEFDADKCINGMITMSCDICNREFTNEAQLVAHIDSHCSKRKCTQCDVSFRTMRELQAHEKERHNIKSEKKYTCHICGMKMSKIWNLKSHISRHSKNNKTKQCRECLKTFYTNNELKIHQRSHSGEKPFLCTECGASYSTSSYLSLHMRRHAKIMNYKCLTCDKEFHVKSLLNDHMLSHHSSEYNFKCSKCDAAFLRRRSLKQHMKIHENKKEYTCQHCDRAFNQQPALYAHVKIQHSNALP